MEWKLVGGPLPPTLADIRLRLCQSRANLGDRLYSYSPVFDRGAGRQGRLEIRVHGSLQFCGAPTSACTGDRGWITAGR
jgi:hypothetical protein